MERVTATFIAQEDGQYTLRDADNNHWDFKFKGLIPGKEYTISYTLSGAEPPFKPAVISNLTVEKSKPPEYSKVVLPKTQAEIWANRWEGKRNKRRQK